MKIWKKCSRLARKKGWSYQKIQKWDNPGILSILWVTSKKYCWIWSENCQLQIFVNSSSICCSVLTKFEACFFKTCPYVKKRIKKIIIAARKYKNQYKHWLCLFGMKSFWGNKCYYLYHLCDIVNIFRVIEIHNCTK